MPGPGPPPGCGPGPYSAPSAASMAWSAGPSRVPRAAPAGLPSTSRQRRSRSSSTTRPTTRPASRPAARPAGVAAFTGHRRESRPRCAARPRPGLASTGSAAPGQASTAGELAGRVPDMGQLRGGEAAERPAQQRQNGGEVPVIQAGQPVVEDAEQVPVVHQQQAAAGQEPVYPGRLASRRHPHRQVSGEPAGRLSPGQHARVGKQPDDPAGQQAVHIGPGGQQGERGDPPVPGGPALVVLGVQAQRGVHPVQRPRSRAAASSARLVTAAGSPAHTRAVSASITSASARVPVPRTSP